jgi:hypothetical protein
MLVDKAGAYPSVLHLSDAPLKGRLHKHQTWLERVPGTNSLADSQITAVKSFKKPIGYRGTRCEQKDVYDSGFLWGHRVSRCILGANDIKPLLSSLLTIMQKS